MLFLGGVEDGGGEEVGVALEGFDAVDPEDGPDKVEAFSKYFTADDSVLIIEADGKYIRKFGNAIHKDKPVVYF